MGFINQLITGRPHIVEDIYGYLIMFVLCFCLPHCVWMYLYEVDIFSSCGLEPQNRVCEVGIESAWMLPMIDILYLYNDILFFNIYIYTHHLKLAQLGYNDGCWQSPMPMGVIASYGSEACKPVKTHENTWRVLLKTYLVFISQCV